ncbi:MAG: energy-coupled thiamine transporter ThiT [Bacilli bacterium]|nr:energy-coupled thiamine transporter ThiT [Bacilli bacterium]
MEETSPKREDKLSLFFKNYGWVISIVCGIISILFLLGVVVTYKVKIGDDSFYYNVHLFDYLKHQNKYDWTMDMTLGFLLGGIICVSLRKVVKDIGTAGGLFFVLAITSLALCREFYTENAIENLKSVSLGWGAVCSIAFAIAAGIFALSDNFSNNPITTRDIAEDGILIASAFVLNLIKLPIATGGGSINFQMLPLYLIALRHGPAHGLICGGIVYGLITCFTDGWGFATYPFDYLIGFGSVMVMGFFKNLVFPKDTKTYNFKGELFLFISAVLATAVRFIGSTASSSIVYGLKIIPAMQYNAIYIPISGAISLAVLMIAYGPLIKINNRYPVNK